MAVRAYYLKKKYNFGYSRYTSLMAGSYIIIFVLSAGMGLGLSLLYIPVHRILHIKLVAIFIGLLLSTLFGTFLLFFIIRLRKRFKRTKINSILEIMKNGYLSFKENMRLIIIFSVFHLLTIFVTGARLFVSFSAIDLKVSFLQILIIASLTLFALPLSLTPANLGIKEGIISFSALLFGIAADEAMLAALIDRGVEIVLTFFFGLIFSRILLSDMKISENN
jgi:uncharacterized protein (TIRG00374 family)